FKRSSANSVTAIIPYFSYAKGDKMDEPRVSIRARVCADCIEAAGVDRVIFMDLHAAQIQGFFKKPVDHLRAEPLLTEYVKRSGILDENLVVVSPDAGSAKRARDFAKQLGCPVAIGDKTRTDHSENAKVLEVIGEVEGKNCLVVDDFSISGGTMIDIARGLKEKGANRIFGALSHNCMNEKALNRFDDSPYEFIVTTDTVECPEARKHPKIKIISAAPMFAQAVKIIHDKAPISTLFDQRISKRMMDMSFAEQLTLLGD
ncbi:MAG: ribose-phosphate pyrophosphokinase, partial [Clostridia bacterium]|nr:ribose-phosphate pyrophosphokinase [Clostridia bacterium]